MNRKSFMVASIFVINSLFLFTAGCKTDQNDKLTSIPPTLEFKEEQLLIGHSLIEKLSFVSQLDQQDTTQWDEYRCSASAAINCYLLMGGSWQNLVAKLGLSDTAMSYSNLHRAQEKLFILSGGDSTGILGMYYPIWDGKGDLTGYQVKKNNLLTFIFENLGMYVNPILPLNIRDPKIMYPAIQEMYHHPTLPKHAEDLRNKKNQVEQYFRKNPTGTIFMGVNENAQTGEIHAAMDERISSQNHYVMCFKRNNSYYLLDTWRKPGQKTLIKLTDQKANELLLHTHNMLLEVYFK